MPRSRIVPLVRLIAVPDGYDGVSVITVGVARFEREESALYMSKEQAESAVRSSAIWLDLDGIEESGLDHLNGSYVLVEGTFDAKGRGHSGASAVGTIKQIKRITPWR